MNQTKNNLLHLPGYVSQETGILFKGNAFVDGNNNLGVTILPAGMEQRHSFSVSILLKWRRLVIAFKPGIFASDLLAAMSAPKEKMRERFISLLSVAVRRGAVITLTPNNKQLSWDDSNVWSNRWKSLEFQLNKANLSVGDNDEVEAADLFSWTSLFFAALISILPLQKKGFKEGDVVSTEINRYERNKRNRLHALAIHGCSCKACGFEFADRYGPKATGYIEVHHITPVSELGPGYMINPETDLIPLCANCHRVAHMRKIPYTVDEIKEMLSENNGH